MYQVCPIFNTVTNYALYCINVPQVPREILKTKDKAPGFQYLSKGAQWLCGRVFDSRPRGHGFEPNWHHFVLSLGKTH